MGSCPICCRNVYGYKTPRSGVSRISSFTVFDPQTRIWQSLNRRSIANKVTIIKTSLLSFFFFFLVWLKRKMCLFHLHESFCCPLIRYLISGLLRFTNTGLSISIYIYISPLVIYIHTWLLFNRYELLQICILILLNLPDIISKLQFLRF